jgi:hypothetical protein
VVAGAGGATGAWEVEVEEGLGAGLLTTGAALVDEGTAWMAGALLDEETRVTRVVDGAGVAAGGGATELVVVLELTELLEVELEVELDLRLLRDWVTKTRGLAVVVSPWVTVTVTQSVTVTFWVTKARFWLCPCWTACWTPW